MSKSIRLSVATLTGLLCVVSFTANATTYYVSTTGDDANPGTISQPFKTVKKGVSMATSPGDIVYLRGGTYNQGDGTNPAAQLTIRVSGTEGNPITLTSYPGETAHITWNGPYADGMYYARIAFSAPGGDTYPIGDYVIQNLELSVGGIVWFGGRRVTIRHNYIHNTGIHLFGGGYRCVVDGNLLMTSVSHGMYLGGSHNFITNNIILAAGTNSTTVSGGYGIQGAGYPFDPTKKPGPEYAMWRNNTIANNTFAYNKAAGVVNWQADAANNTYENNIFYENGWGTSDGNGAHGIQWQSSGGGNLVKNNLFYATLPGAQQQDMIGGTPGVTYTETGSDRANPLFTNAVGSNTLPGTWDFHLRSGSPAIDKGLSIPTVTTKDFMGAARPQGAYDIGAYEYAAGAVIAQNRQEANTKPGPIFIKRSGNGVTIHGIKSSAVLYTLSGKTLATFGNIGANGAAWSPGKAQSGVYLVKVTSGNTVYLTRVFLGK